MMKSMERQIEGEREQEIGFVEVRTSRYPYIPPTRC